MYINTALGLIAAIVSPVAALSGQATTTRYYDGQKGACGCGPTNGGSAFSWQAGIGNGIYTAAGSQALFGSGTWCGSGCGTCYQLTSTGTAPSGQGTGGSAGKSIIVMLTNLCPYNGNQVWCPNPGSKNQFGFSYHFDLQSNSPIIGDNSIVNFQQVSCPSAALSDYKQCQCHT